MAHHQVGAGGLLTPPASLVGGPSGLSAPKARSMSGSSRAPGSLHPSQAAALARQSDELRRTGGRPDPSDASLRSYRTPVGIQRKRRPPRISVNHDPDAPSSDSDSDSDDDGQPLSLAQQRRRSAMPGSASSAPSPHARLGVGTTTPGYISTTIPVRRTVADFEESDAVLIGRPVSPYGAPYAAAADGVYNPLNWKPAPRPERPHMLIGPSSSLRTVSHGGLAASIKGHKPSRLRSGRHAEQDDDTASNASSFDSPAGPSLRGGRTSATGSASTREPPIVAPDSSSFFTTYQPSLHEPGRHRPPPHEGSAFDSGLYGLKRSFAQFKLDTRMAVHRANRKLGV